MLCLFEVDYQRSGRADSQRIRVYGIAFQRFYTELFFQFFHCRIIYECPFFQCGDVEFVAEQFLHLLLETSLDHDFFRIQRGDEGADVFRCSLGYLEGARGDVQEGGAAHIFGKCQSREKVVLFLVEHVFAESDARRNHFSHTALHQCPGKFRVLQLIADCDLVSGSDKPRKVLFYSMMRKAGHRHGFFVAVRSLGLYKSEDFAH